MKNVCVLIISSDTEYYNKMESVWIKYMNNYRPEAMCFFVKCSEDIKENVEEIGNTIYVKEKEHFLNVLYKTVISIKYILDKYESIKYIFRTNLSTFLNIPKYLESYKTDSVYSGVLAYHDNTYYISGVCITLSRDVCEYLVLNYNKNDTKYITNFYEDVEIGRIVSKKYNPININNRLNLCNDTIEVAINKIKNQNENIYVYRCRSDDRNHDSILLNLLCEMIYKL